LKNVGCLRAAGGGGGVVQVAKATCSSSATKKLFFFISHEFLEKLRAWHRTWSLYKTRGFRICFSYLQIQDDPILDRFVLRVHYLSVTVSKFFKIFTTPLLFRSHALHVSWILPFAYSGKKWLNWLHSKDHFYINRIHYKLFKNVRKLKNVRSPKEYYWLSAGCYGKLRSFLTFLNFLELSCILKLRVNPNII